jgi:predicted TIM-barrel fold metal-dependent hydrolase
MTVIEERAPMAQLTNEEYSQLRMLKYPKPPVSFIPEPEAEQLFCPIISVDDHLLEPANLFEGRLPRRLQPAAPFQSIEPDGMPWWVIDGVKVPIQMVNGASGRPVSEWSLTPASYDELRRAVWDPKARLHDMDLTGVWASLCFGSVIWGFAGTRFANMGDKELGLACVRAYNDWVHEEWVGAAPDRYLACQLPWLAHAADAAKEIYRNAERGFTSVSFSENPEGLGYPNIYDPYWDPFFRACEETATVVNLHVGSSGITHRPCSSSADAVSVALFPVSGLHAIIDWVYAEIPLKYPKLTVALSEAGVSWVPAAIERLRRGKRQSAAVGKGWPYGDVGADEIVRRNFVFTSIEDHAGFEMLHLIGEDNVMVETDYPHFDSTWPECQQMIRSELERLDTAVIRKVCFENAARVYRCALPPQELIDASEVGRRQLAAR